MKKILLIFIIIPILIISSCKKYEEGPAVSFRSKRKRVENSWVASKVIQNGSDVTSEYSGWIYVFSGSSFRFSNNGADQMKGWWEFNSGKEYLILHANPVAGSTLTQATTVEFKILKLKDDEMWLYDSDNVIELHFMPL